MQGRTLQVVLMSPHERTLRIRIEMLEVVDVVVVLVSDVVVVGHHVEAFGQELQSA